MAAPLVLWAVHTIHEPNARIQLALVAALIFVNATWMLAGP